jgi:rhodanese-related sulfurtransferase
VKVTIVETLDWLLPKLLDFEVATYIEQYLKSEGIEFQFGQRVKGFRGDDRGWVQGVITDNLEIDAQMVVLAIGNKPNTELAKSAGLNIGPVGGIEVNEYLQTNDPDIYAGGDCVETVHHITKKKELVPLGSTANKHGRIIGSNLAGNHESCPDVLGTSIVKIIHYNVGKVGLSESQARDNGFEVFTSLVPSYDHATYYPGSRQILIKLIADKSNGRLLGCQIAGPGDVSKRIDVLATALNFNATVNDLANLDLAYAPPYNSAIDPLHHAANIIRNKISGYAKALTPMEVKERMSEGNGFILLDVRSRREWQNNHIASRQSILIPINEIRSRLHEVPVSKEIITYCQTSVRAYQAQRILNGAGFAKVKFMDGSIASWPYDLEGTRSINR